MIQSEPIHKTRQARTGKWRPLHSTSRTVQITHIRQGITNPEPTYRSNIEFRGSTELVSDLATDTLQLPISQVTTREMVLNREASADYFEPNSNTPESGQLPCPQSNSDAYHKRKKSLRTKQRVTSSSLHTRPDLKGDGNDGQCDNQQHNPLYNGSALYNYSNEDRFARPIFNDVADKNRRRTDLGKAITDGDTRNTCGSGDIIEIDGECCNFDANNRRWMDLRRSEDAPRCERLITSDTDTAGHCCDSDPQQHPLPSSAAVACICRDARGRIIEGFTKSIEAKSAELAEAQALVETLNFISSKIVPYRSEQQILIHSDCRTLVDAVLSSETLSWEIQPLVDRAKRKLEDSSSIILAHCNRDTNRVADWLAKAHRLGCLPRDWVNYPPPALLDLLCADASYVCTNNCS